MPRSPIRRVGGKFYLAKAIIEQFPEHKRYIEVFGIRKKVDFTGLYRLLYTYYIPMSFFGGGIVWQGVR